MSIRQLSVARSQPRGASRAGLGARRTTTHSAFTLIEIMIVVGIMAVIMAIGIPSVYQQMHKDSMRQAMKDLGEACTEARSRAILAGITTELRIRPRDRSINVIEGSRAVSTGNPSYAFEGEQIVERPASGGAIFSAKFSDHIAIDFLEVNKIAELHERDEVTCLFYKDGTSDELTIILRSDKGESRLIKTDVVTGSVDWEVLK